MEIFGVSSNGLLSDYTLKTGAAGATTNSGGNTGTVGDSTLFSPMALQLSNAAGSDKTSFSSSSLTTRFGTDEISFNNSTGAITWNGTKLNLSGIAKLTDDIIIQKDGSALNVYNVTQSTEARLNAYDGSRALDPVTKDPLDPTAPAVVGGKSQLIINNSGGIYSGGTQDDVIINTSRSSAAEITGGGGNDKIFNFSATTKKMDAGTGKGALYTVGLTDTNATLTATGSEAYLKILGNMAGGTITVGVGKNVIDASTVNLSNVKIQDGGGTAETELKAKGITNTNPAQDISLTGAVAKVDVTTLASNLTFGTGANSLESNNLKDSTITSTGANDDFTLKAITNSTIDSSGATNVSLLINGAVKNSIIELGKELNELKAGSRAFTDTQILNTNSAAPVQNNIALGSMTGGKIELGGSDIGNSINISGAVKSASIETGNGIGQLVVGSLVDATIDMASTSTNPLHEQDILVKGNVSGTTTITTGEAKDVLNILGNVAGTAVISLGDGADKARIAGTVTGDVTVDMADGDNELYVGKGAKGLTYVGGDDKDDVILNGGATNSTFDLGEGANTLDAFNKTLSNVDITASGNAATDVTTLSAGAFKGGHGASNTGNEITLGDGPNTINFASITGNKTYADTGVTINMGATTATQAQTLNLTGNMAYATVNTGAGDDVLDIKGAITKSAINTYDGNDSLSVGKAINGLTYTAGDATGTRTIAAKASIANSTFTLGDGDLSFSAINAKNVAQTLSNVSITTGKGDSTIVAGAFKAGADNKSITLGEGDHNVTLGAISKHKTGNAEISLANGFDNDQILTVNGAINGLTYAGAKGSDTITVLGSIANSDFDLDEGTNSLTAEKAGKAQNMSNVDISATGATAADVTTIKAGVYTTAKTGNTISLGDGANDISLTGIKGGSATGKLDLTMGETTAALAQKLAVAGNVGHLNFVSLGGDDEVIINGSVGSSSFDLGDGDNKFKAFKLAKDGVTEVGQTLTDVSITSTGTGSTEVFAGAYKAKAGNTISLTGDGNNTVILSSLTGLSNTDRATIQLGNGTEDGAIQRLEILGLASNLNYIGSAGKDELIVRGGLTNATIDLGKTKTNTAGDGNVLDVTVLGKDGVTYMGQKLTNVDIKAGDDSYNQLYYGNFVHGKNGNSILTGQDSTNVTMDRHI